VTIDHPPVSGGAVRFINVDDCEKVTRQLQHVLEVEGLAYERLEVSSPGLDRPLKTAADFARFEGEQVEVTLKLPFKGRKRFRGELLANGEGWRIVLAPTAAKAAAKKHAESNSAKARAAAAGLVTEAGGADEVKVLDFSLDEMREARLIPVIDFKGRRSAPAGAGAHEAQAHEEMDGGRIQ
jgi:ribosome maturation factor RimP